MLACADFETTTNIDDCRVWAFSIIEIGNYNNFVWGNSINEFMEFCSNKKENHVLYFHNLKFDGEFIFYWLFENGFKSVKDSKKLVTKSFSTLISDKGQFYSIEICFEKNGHKTNKVTIYDSLKILNFSVTKIAKDFDLPISKLEIDYKMERKIGYNLSEEEINYIKNDVEIVARALEILFSMGMNKMTIGANALNEYNNVVGKKKFEKVFPIPTNEMDYNVRQSYKGGFTFLNKKYKNKTVGDGIVLDVNSLYPSVMYSAKLPYGEGIFFEGKYKSDKLYDLYVQTFTCSFQVKEGFIPTIQIKNTLSFIPTEYLENSGNEEVKLTLTNIDLELFLKHYDVYNIEYLRGYKFKSTTNLFKKYIDKWVGVKIQSKKDNNSSMYTISKLMLNTLYGKFSVNPNIRGKYPTYDKKSGLVKYVYGEWEERKPIYIPVGTFITSWARYKTISAAQKVYDRFIYADTDSLHLEGTELPKDLEIDDYKLGAWKLEFIFSKGKYLRQKSYMEYGKEPNEVEEYVKITCAGMPSTCYKNVDFDNFKIGSSFAGKLQQTRVKGGIVLKDIDFTIKK